MTAVLAPARATVENEVDMSPAVDSTRTTSGARIVLLETAAELVVAIDDAWTWPVLSLDVETAHQVAPQYDEHGKIKRERLDYNRLALRSIQFGNEQVVYVIDCARLPHWRTPALVHLLQEHPEMIAHNAAFEYGVFLRHGIRCDTLRCTMYAEKVLYQGLGRPLGLAALVERYLGREMPKDVRDTFIEEREVLPLRPEQIRYAADDVDVLMPIYRQQCADLAAADLEPVGVFEWEVRRAFSRISARGVYLNEAKWRALMEENIAKRDAAQEHLYNIFKPAAVKRWEALLAEREARRDELIGLIAAASGRNDRDAFDRYTAELTKLPSWLKKKPNKETGLREPKKTTMWDFTKVLSSHMQLKGAFLELGLDLPDTNERTLLLAKREHEEYRQRLAAGERLVFPETDVAYVYPAEAIDAIDRLLEYRGLDKRVSTYGQNWLDAISPVTGLIHTDYDTVKDTARTGASDPNIQNVPKRGDGKVYREAFTTPELLYVARNRWGHEFWTARSTPGPTLIDQFNPLYVVADYSQIELRVAAELSGDRNMIRAFQSGLDIHLATASLMFKKDPAEISKDQRTAAKCVNFGILFGIGPGKLAEQITNQPGAPPCSFDNAKRFLRMYGKSYPQLMDWLAEMGSLGRQQLVTHTILGHRRRFERPVRPDPADYRGRPAEYSKLLAEYQGRLAGIERESKNTPVQGSAAVIAKAAILDLERVLPQYNAGIVLFVHDEIGVICPDLYAEEVAAVLKGTMEAAGARFMQRVPCVAEVEIGLDWLGGGFEEVV